jgi:uncharacterized repeat protein (TIGR01451 family)
MCHKSTCLLVGVGVAAMLLQPWTAWAQGVGPRLVIDKSHSGNFTVGVNGIYTIVVSNIGDAASSGQITVEDRLPYVLVVVSAIGTGWSCVVRSSCPICPGASEVVDCNSSSGIAPGGSAFPITLTVRPFTYGGTVTNTAFVSGGGDPVGGMASDPTIVLAAVPTLPEWAIIVLSALLALAGVAALRRRTT